MTQATLRSPDPAPHAPSGTPLPSAAKHNARTARAAGASAKVLAQNTPDDRDRVVDFLRAASIIVVVLGHWLMASVTIHNGRFHAANTLTAVPMLQHLTWILQVIPVFFFVGGFSNSVTITAMRRRGKSSAEFVVSRAERLLRPVFVLLAVWVPLAILLGRLGLSNSLLGPATKLVAQPLWFIAVYLMVTALAPWMRSRHDHHGAWVLAALTLSAIAVDVSRFSFGLDGLGFFNLFFVWLFAQQLGFLYADGTLLRFSPRGLRGIAAAAFATLILLTTVGPYPVSMVGLPGERISNMSPPTICLLVLTVMQVALVLLARSTLTRWLQRERNWTAVVALNGIIMTVFLWHLTAMIIVLTVMSKVAVAQPAAGSAMWWLTRPVWFSALLVPLSALVAVFSKLERPIHAHTANAVPKAALTTLGVFGVVIGIGGVAATDLVQLGAPGRAHIAVITLSTLQCLVLLLLGAALLRPKANHK